MPFPLAGLRGGSSLSGCRVESPALGTGAKRPVQVKGETLPSEVNAMRHFVLGIIRRKTLTVSAKCVSACSRGIERKMKIGLERMVRKWNEAIKAQWAFRQERSLQCEAQ